MRIFAFLLFFASSSAFAQNATITVEDGRVIETDAGYIYLSKEPLFSLTEAKSLAVEPEEFSVAWCEAYLLANPSPVTFEAVDNVRRCRDILAEAEG